MKRFLTLQVICLVAWAAFVTFAPRNRAACATVQVYDDLPSVFRLGDYKPSVDVQFTGTIARSFLEQRTLEAAARIIADTTSGNAARPAFDAVPNRLNHTILLTVESTNPAAARKYLYALLEARSQLDREDYRAAIDRSLKVVEARAHELHEGLTRSLDALRDSSIASGDPLEIEARLRSAGIEAAAIERTCLDMNARAGQLQNKLLGVDAAIKDIRDGKSLSPFVGFEDRDSGVLAPTTPNFMDPAAVIRAASVPARDQQIAESSSSLMRNATDLVKAETAYGRDHVQTRQVRVRIEESRGRLLSALVEQRNEINAAIQSLGAITASLNRDATAARKEIKKLAESRTDPEFLKRSQTAAGLQRAYLVSMMQTQTLLTAAATCPPLFALTEIPSDSTLPAKPGALPCLVAAEIAFALLFWLTSRRPATVPASMPSPRAAT